MGERLNEDSIDEENNTVQSVNKRLSEDIQLFRDGNMLGEVVKTAKSGGKEQPLPLIGSGASIMPDMKFGWKPK